jgi:hypothetical protein
MHTRGVLKLATLGMFLYATFSIGWAGNDLVRGAQLEAWAGVAMVVFGLLLALSAAFLRARIPGGLPFAIAALLGLQALDVHNAVHLETGLAAQVARGALGLLLIGIAFVGGLPRRGQGRGTGRSPAADRHRPPAG